MTTRFIETFQELQVYQLAFEAAMQVTELAQSFPEPERTTLREPVIDSSRLVCERLARAWGRRRYRGAFVALLNQAEAEAIATQVWLEFAVLSAYVDAQLGQELMQTYSQILTGLGRLINHASAWTGVGRNDHETGL